MDIREIEGQDHYIRVFQTTGKPRHWTYHLGKIKIGVKLKLIRINIGVKLGIVT